MKIQLLADALLFCTAIRRISVCGNTNRGEGFSLKMFKESKNSFYLCINMSTPFPSEQGAQGGLFIFMPKAPYTKSALSYAGQLQQLKNRGLIVENDAKALHLLENISYYRLSGYWYPMLAMPKIAHHFKSGSTFNNVFKLYCFDRELRKLILGELEKIEIAPFVQK